MSNEEQKRSFTEDGLTVNHKGQVEVPGALRDVDGFVPRSLIAVTITTDDGEAEQFNKRITSDWRVTIPARLRNEHGIGQGDSIDVEFEVMV